MSVCEQLLRGTVRNFEVEKTTTSNWIFKENVCSVLWQLHCDLVHVLLQMKLREKEKGQAIATMANTNEGSTTGMTDEEHFLSEYLKKISD